MDPRCSQCAVDGDVVGVDDVLDVDHRGDRHAAFIDSARAGDVRVAIDDAGNEILPARFDNGGAGRHHHLLADFGDLTVFHHHGALEDAFGAFGHDGGVLNHDGFGAQWRERQQCRQDHSLHCFPPGPGSSVAAPPRPPGVAVSAGVYFLPSTNTITTVVRSSKISPLVTTRLAILPFSMLPTRSAMP